MGRSFPQAGHRRQRRLLEIVFSRFPIHVSMCCLKSLIGSWHTDRRLHETDARGCLFGCPHQRDDLNHYTCCPALHRALAKFFWDRPPFASWIHDPSRDSVVFWFLAFSAYHAVRIQEAPPAQLEEFAFNWANHAAQEQIPAFFAGPPAISLD